MNLLARSAFLPGEIVYGFHAVRESIIRGINEILRYAKTGFKAILLDPYKTGYEGVTLLPPTL